MDYGTVSAYLCDPDVALFVRRPLHWSPDMGQRIAQAANAQVGQGYNYLLIAAMAISHSVTGYGIDLITKGWFGRTVCRWADSQRRAICSEVVAASMQPQPEVANLGCLKYPAFSITPLDEFKDRFVYEPADFACELVQ